MKVAISFPGCHRRGGVERIVLECARFLGGRDHQVDVYARDFDAQEVADLAGSIHHCPVAMRQTPRHLAPRSYFQNATSALEGADYDVLNTHGCVCPVGGVVWIQSLHRSWLDRSRAFRSIWSPARWKQKLNPLHPVLLDQEDNLYGKRRYQKIIATTPEVQADLHRYYGVPAEDVLIVPNGFSPTEFNPEMRAARRVEMRQRHGIADDHIALLFVANELERKGYYTILDAMGRLNDPRVHLHVIGGVSAKTVNQKAQGVGLADHVHYHGLSSDVAGFHAAADLFVLPTQYEAFCLAILESLGSGLPVITTRIPGANDAIQTGLNGYIIDDPNSGTQLAEALKPLLERDVIDALSASTPATVIQYQWPNVLQRYEDILLSFAGSY